MSCEGENSGRCRGGKRARVYPSVQGLPTRAHPIKFMEQDVDWTDLPGLSTTVPLDLNTRINLPFRGGTDITSFKKDDSTYLALSIYVDPDTNFRSTSSVLFRVREVGQSLDVMKYQTFETYGAQAVNTWVMGWCAEVCDYGVGRYLICTGDCVDTTFVMFACDATSPLFRWDDDLKKLIHVQDVPTKNATSLEPFVNDDISYVIVTQAGPMSTLYRWNGTLLLGPTDENTRLKDTAGGQDIPMHSAHAVLHFPMPSQTDYMVFGNHMDGVTPSFMLRARTENVIGLGTPLRILSRTSEATGESFVYAACYGSNAIQVFQRSGKELYFSPVLSTVRMDGTLEGLTDVAVFGSFLYSVSSLSDGGSINVFVFNQNGSLTERQDMKISAKNTLYGLQGVRSIHVQNNFVYTASFVDQAMTVFERQPSGDQEGALKYVDHVVNGERVVSSFKQYTVSTHEGSFYASSKTFLEGGLPDRVGRKEIGQVVSCIAHELVDHRHLFAVAYMAVNLDCTVTNCNHGNDTISDVFIYEYLLDEFIEIQILTGLQKIVDFEFFQVLDLDSKKWDFLLVISEDSYPSTFRYDPQDRKYVFYKDLSFRLPDSSFLPPECENLNLCESSSDFKIPGVEQSIPAWDKDTPRNISGRRAKSFVINNQVFLAIAFWWPFSNDHGWFSLVYRWQLYGSTVLEDGKTAKGSGFEVFQVIPTQGALDVDVASFTSSGLMIDLLIFVNFGDIDHISSCKVYKYSGAQNALTGRLGVFSEIQSLQGVGISGVITFSIGNDHFMATAVHGVQTKAPWSATGESALYQGSAIYKWHVASQRYEMYQDLDSFYSVSIHDEHAVQRIPAMIAASDFDFFEWNGDRYLIIAQNLCNITAFSDACLSSTLQPKSAVLQWNPVKKTFGELLALTNATNIALRRDPVRDAEAERRSQALRLISPGAIRATTANLGSKLLLIMITKQSGSIFYDFKFEQISGLSSPTAIVASSGTNPTIYVASGQDSGLAIANLIPSLDDVGNKLNLTYRKTIFDLPEAATISTLGANIIGLAGALRLHIRDRYLVVRSGLPADERRCTEHQIWALGEEAYTLAGKSWYPCQEVSFTLTTMNMTNPALFEEFPRISDNGTLHFKTAAQQHGQAVFEVQLNDDGLYSVWTMYADLLNYPPGDPDELDLLARLSQGRDQSVAIQFILDVAPVNDAPTFDAELITLTQNSGVNKSIIFARNVSAGAKNENDQHVRFEYLFDWDRVPDYACQERVASRDFTRVTYQAQGLAFAVQKCQELCDASNDCNFISFTDDYYPCHLSETCTWQQCTSCKSSQGKTLISSDVYFSPKDKFQEQPVLYSKMDIATGQLVGVADFAIKPSARGVVRMRVFAIDTGEMEVLTGSMTRSTGVTVSIGIIPSNIGPRFSLLPTIAVDASSGSHFRQNFITDIDAGDGECFCGDLSICIPGEESFCQSVSFELYDVQTIDGIRPNSTTLFEKFQVLGDVNSNSRNLSFSLQSHWSGRYRVSVWGKDHRKDGRETNGDDGRVLTFELVVKAINERPSFHKLDTLSVAEEQRVQGILQRHSYFSDVHAGSGDLDLDVLYQTSFTILELNCSSPSYPDFQCENLFDVIPTFDAQGFVSFVLKPFIFGQVRALVLPQNSGPKPESGFQSTEVFIDVVDVNTPPSCSFPDSLITIENRGYSSFPNFSYNVWTGPQHEQWQHLIYQIEVDKYAPDVFASLPIIDGHGTLSFETAVDSFGDAVLTVTCRDNGGVSFGGSDTGASQQVHLTILPQPRVYSITPGIWPRTETNIFTVKGKHFGSMMSRGYKRDVYEFVDVFVGPLPCEKTIFVSDGELICEKAPSAHGVQDVSVLVTDPFCPSSVKQDLRREGRLQGGIVFPSFYALAGGFIGIGSLYDKVPAGPVVKMYNGSDTLPILPEVFCDHVDENATNKSSESNVSNTSNKSNASHTRMHCTSFCHAGFVLSRETGDERCVQKISNSSTPNPDHTVLHQFVSNMRVWFNCSSDNGYLKVENILGLNSSEVQFFCHSSRDQERSMSLQDLCRTILSLNSSAMQNFTENVTYAFLGLEKECKARFHIPEMEQAPAKVEIFASGFLGAARAAVEVGGELFVGGSFLAVNNSKLSHVARWSNMRRKDSPETVFLPCENGLDGAVSAMDRYQGTAVMGGTFTFAAMDGGSNLHSGGLIAWDPVHLNWILVGRTRVEGTVSSILSTDGGLYIGGRFGFVGGQEVNNLALHSGLISDPGGWSSIGGGVKGGHVAALTRLGRELYVGGSFVSFL